MSARALAVPAALLVAVAGCSSSTTTSPAPTVSVSASTTTSADAWVTALCAGLTSVSGRAAGLQTAADQLQGSPTTSAATLTSALAGIRDDLTALGTGLTSAGAPPVTGGQDVQNSVTVAVSGAVARVQGALDALSAVASSTDAATVAAAVQKAGAAANDALQGIGTALDAADDQDRSGALQAAVRADPACAGVITEPSPSASGSSAAPSASASVVGSPAS